MTLQELKDVLNKGYRVLVSHPTINGNWRAVMEGKIIVCYRNNKTASYSLTESDLIAYTSNKDFTLRIDCSSVLKAEIDEIING